MNRITHLSLWTLGLLVATAAGCQSKYESGVKSNYRSQWTTVAATTEETTEAAEEVLNEQGLKNVTSSSTRVDGRATGTMADGTEVKVAVRKQENDAGSQVSVTVGTVGDPQLGADLAKQIKTEAEDD